MLFHPCCRSQQSDIDQFSFLKFVVASGVYYVVSVAVPPRETFITQAEMDEVKEAIDGFDEVPSEDGERASPDLKLREKGAGGVDVKEV
jgi:hypothetical protein